MTLSYHNLYIEISLEGIIQIESFHLAQKLNEHGNVQIKFLVEEDAAISFIEQADSNVFVCINRSDDKQQTIFQGYAEQIYIKNEQGLYYAYLNFYGFTKKWDLTNKSRSFCKSNDTYMTVIDKILSDYSEKEVKDEASEDSKIPGMLMQYEETDWEFLKRLVSHFSTFLVADNSQNFGKVYFGIPHIEQGVILSEKEYTVLKGKEQYERLEDTGNIMPQDMMCWRIRSLKSIKFGEQVMLGHIEAVVTGVEIYTEQGELVFEYELSRRKGILTAKKKNSKIFGMSIPATVKERKGNQIRVHMDIDAEYEASDDLKYFTYAIETSNFYCMPEEESRVHIYFPDYDEQNAMAVHAISGGEGNNSKSNAVSYGVNFDRAGSSNVYHHSGSSGSDYHENVSRNDIGGSSMPAAATIMPAKGTANAQPAQPDKKETPKASKDPAYKKFSDPSGSYLELAPRGITFCPGNKLIMVKLLKTGTLTVQAENIVINTKAMLGVGISKGGPMQEISMIAQKKLNLVLGDNDSRIDMEENTRIVATFIYQEAKIKRAAQPLASVIKSNITKNDAAKREEINSSVKEDYSEIAMDIKQMLLDEKAREARAQIFDAAMTAVMAVSCVAIICCSGGTATPLVVQGAAILMGSYSVTMSISETYEGVSDLNKAANGDLSRSYNPMRDSWYGGNEELYQGIGMINNMALSMMAGNVMGSANNGRQASQMLMKYRQWCSQHKVLGTVMRGFGNALGDFAYTFARDLADNGHLDFGLSWAMTGSGLLKGITMSLAGGIASAFTKTVGGHIAATIGGQISAGIAYDFGESKVFGYEYNPYYSSISTTAASILGFLFGDPIDPVTGAYLVTSTDLILPDNLVAVKLERHYSSVNHNVGWLGRGWRFTYESRILSHGEIYYVQLPDGHCASFETKTFISMPGSSQYKLTYDSMREKWEVMDVAHHTCYCYEKNGLLQSVIDRNGMSITFTYAGEYLLQMKTPMGEIVDFEFEKGKLTALKDNHGHIITYQYEDDFLKQVVHIDGNVLQYEYTENGYLAKQIDKLGHYPLENQYDEKGRVVLQTLENGDTYSAEYRERERQTLVEYSAYPGIICYTYNRNLLIEEVKYADGSMEQFTYDDARNRVREIDRLGRVTTKKYNDIGLLVEENRPEGLKWKYHYSEHFDLESISNNAGMERRFAYDIYHNLILRRDKISEDHWSETSYGYDLRGRVLWETDGNGNTTRYSYQGEMVYPDSVTYPDGCECHFEYDRMGRKLAETDECGRTEYAYDRKNHMTMVRDGEGNETHYTYDGKGRKLSAYTPLQWKNKNGRFTSYQYDIFGRLLDTVYADGSHERLYRDGEGNIIKRVHPNSFATGTKDGEGTCYDYDGENRLHRIHYPDGGVERFFYDSEGNRIKHVLPEQYDPETDDGEGWQYAYDEGNRLISVTGPEGITEESYEYDLQGNCIRRRDERGCSTYYAYDLLGRLVQELAPVGEESDKACYRKTTYIYDDNNNKIREIHHGGNYGADGDLLTEGEDLTLTFAYDARNRLVRVSDEQGAKTAYRYDARGNCISEEQNIRNGEGGHRPVLKKIKYVYDRAGRLTEKREILDSGLADAAGETAITGYAYDENSNCTRIITPEGYEISRSYDDRDRLIEEKLEDKANGIERTTRISYDKAGNVVSVRQTGKDGRSREITYDYDLKDRLTHAGELEGPVFALSYDKNDRRTEQKQLLAMEEEKYGSLTFRYDIRGNLTESIQNNLSRQKYQYDLRGNLVGQTDGDGMEVTYRYGLQDEQTHTYTTASRKQGRPAQKLTYDARGRITRVEDGCGNRTGYQSDAWGRVTAIETAEGGREEYAYDPAGNITRTTDARGGVISYDYNSQGKVCAITDQQGNTETFRYDREGRQIQHTDRKGTVTETKYNIYGQPTLQTCTDSEGNRHVMGTWEYDDFGQLKKSVAGGFCYTYLYRPDGKLLKKWNSGKQVISCDYYRNGSLKSLRDVSGKSLQYTYDEAGRLAELKDEEGNTLTEYDYTVGGRIKEIRTSNGIITSYEYDGDGNISRLTIGNGTEEGLLYDAFMLYDLNGNRLGKTGQRIGVEGKQEMNTVFCYDVMNRLTMENRREGGEKYAYDLGGNRLSRQRYHYALTANSNMDSVIDDEESYCYNERNELTQRRNLLSVTEYIYDENGSLIREKEGEKETGYRYDLLNRQTHVHLPNGREQENLYDGEGLRAGLIENGKSTTFLFYNGEILAECDGDSMPIRRHLSGLGLSGVEDISTGTGHTYHQDEQGSTAYVTGTTGKTENLYSYDGFGNILESREGIQNRILYTGQQYDQETGQYYLRARYYNPVIGRFTQEDTYRGDGLNLYAYCSNNPVKYYDPSGHMQLGYGDDYNAAGNTGAAEINDNISNVNGSGQGIEGGTYSSLRDLMTPEEAARYDRYWSQGTGTIQGVKEDGNWVKKIMDGKYENTRQRMYTNPGTRSIMDVKLGSDGNMYYRETIFDEFGRKIGHNDYTDHGRADHANPHYHSNAVNDPSQHGAHTPGLLQ